MPTANTLKLMLERIKLVGLHYLFFVRRYMSATIKAADEQVCPSLCCLNAQQDPFLADETCTYLSLAIMFKQIADSKIK